MASLLAVDVGLRTGLAFFGRDGRLLFCQSRKLGSRDSLRRIAATLLKETPELAWLVLEGGGPLADIWRRAAARRRLSVLEVAAETWRARLLLSRQQRTGEDAKKNALSLAEAVIRWSGAPKAKGLREDTAEAVLVGLYGVLALGWLDRVPPDLPLPPHG